MNIHIKHIYISIFLIIGGYTYGQSYLSNPSFEGIPADATMPTGWFSMSEGTTPDILPGFWGVYKDAEDGETFIGLIVRPDGSYESIGQRLAHELEEGACYQMGLYLSHSDNYAGYVSPLQIRIWISDKNKKRQQLIYESDTIESEEWEYHGFDFKPEKGAQYFIIEAYNPTKKKSYKGNILIDGITQPRICNRV